jgi:hypothetical protein
MCRGEYSLVCVNVTKLKIKGGRRTPWHVSHATTPTSKVELYHHLLQMSSKSSYDVRESAAAGSGKQQRRRVYGQSMYLRGWMC